MLVTERELAITANSFPPIESSSTEKHLKRTIHEFSFRVVDRAISVEKLQALNMNEIKDGACVGAQYTTFPFYFGRRSSQHRGLGLKFHVHGCWL